MDKSRSLRFRKKLHISKLQQFVDQFFRDGLGQFKYRILAAD